MDKQKIKVVLISCIVILSLFVIYYYAPTVKAEGPEMVIWDETLIDSDGTFWFPTVALAHNGTLVCMYRAGHGGTSGLYYKLSHDYGDTWVSKTQISGNRAGGLLGTAPNGEIFCRAATGNGDYDIHSSTNNGTTFEFKYNFNDSAIGDGNGAWMIDRYAYTYGNALYWSFYEDTTAPGHDAYYMYTTNNGSTNTSESWSIFGSGPINEGGANEFSIVPLNANGTWRTLHRDSNGWTNNVITYNNGSTWSSTGEDNPANSNFAPVVWWLDDETIIATIEANNNAANVYISTDLMESWSLVETVATNSHYIHGVNLPKRDGDIGGWAYIVTVMDSYNTGGNVYGWKVANNQTMIWEEPAGPIKPPLQDNNIFNFQSINNQQNNTITYDVISDFNWTHVDNAVYYQLQIANDSAFADIFIDINVNATNFPATYTEVGNYVEFTLPESYRKDWFKNYYFRFRPIIYYTEE